MPPKAAANTTKKRGRPAKNAAASPAPAPVAEPKKRGRPAKVAPVEAPTPEPVVEQPKRRVRAPKAASIDAPAQIDDNAPKRRGRPPKDVAQAVDAAPATPQRSSRGRPARTSKPVIIPPVASGVIASPRVSKRTSPRRRAVAAAPPAAPRVNARVRTRLHTRAPLKKSTADAVPTSPARKKSKRGRPRKDAGAAPAKKISAVKTSAVKTSAVKTSAVKTSAVKTGRIEKPATQPAVRRHRAAKGMTTLEVPKKLLSQIKRYIQDLEEAQTQAEEGARQQALENAVDEETGHDALDGAQEADLQTAALEGKTTAVVEVTAEEAQILGISVVPSELPTELEAAAQRELGEAVEDSAAVTSGVEVALSSTRTSPEVEFDFEPFEDGVSEIHNGPISASVY